ncbi:MAG: thylakoid membrane photosystem I accumulation factor [Hormoscilla sp.]
MTDCRKGRILAAICLFVLSVTLSWMPLLGTPPALAGINDDKFDGNIFALYGGNGSLIPPKVTLAQALKRDKPILLMFYVEDSRDCKQYSTVVSQLQASYGVPADFILIDVDAILPKSTYEPTEPGYYYEGLVPQTLILDSAGKVVFKASGNIPFERVDDAFRKVFDLLPRSESVELRRRPVNEINVELTQ